MVEAASCEMPFDEYEYRASHQVEIVPIGKPCPIETVPQVCEHKSVSRRTSGSLASPALKDLMSEPVMLQDK